MAAPVIGGLVYGGGKLIKTAAKECDDEFFEGVGDFIERCSKKFVLKISCGKILQEIHPLKLIKVGYNKLIAELHGVKERMHLVFGDPRPHFEIDIHKKNNINMD
ncbi:hypothetical protein C1645_740884 [Glomus cerebriforme]|uniref:Uncharacterized protein n=1 Tax=Glomus cerebriforme TaxID=658196 RepID=A0A397SJL1_9GLOM|nr:hypothetical protein C1645_740884 [Glomus cerebriforme]